MRACKVTDSPRHGRGQHEPTHNIVIQQPPYANKTFGQTTSLLIVLHMQRRLLFLVNMRG